MIGDQRTPEGDVHKYVSVARIWGPGWRLRFNNKSSPATLVAFFTIIINNGPTGMLGPPGF